MLNNAGSKIVIWSKVLLYLGIALSLAAGLFMIWRGVDTPSVRYTLSRSGTVYNTGVLSGSRLVIAGFLVIIFGSLAAWLGALVLRAFGELSIDTRTIRRRLEYTFYETRVQTPVTKAEAPEEAKAEAKPEESPAEPPAEPQAEEPEKQSET